MNASMERLADGVWLVRVHDDGHGFGDPYSYAVVAVSCDTPTVVEVKGALRAPRPSEWRAIRRVLAEHGCTRAYINRRDRNRTRFIRLRD